MIVCIFIINNQKDLVNVDAVVTKVTKDADGSGKNDVKSIYMVNGTPHEYEFSTTDDLNVDDSLILLAALPVGASKITLLNIIISSIFNLT